MQDLTRPGQTRGHSARLCKVAQGRASSGRPVRRGGWLPRPPSFSVDILFPAGRPTCPFLALGGRLRRGRRGAV
eukprot:246470-Pyramimonas_sp.AAC.1